MFELPTEAGEPDFIALFAYWSRQAPPGRLPGRQHLDPLDMPRDLLPRLILFDVERALDGPLFRVRLAGTQLVELFGGEPRGRHVHQLGLVDEGQSLTGALKAVVTMAAPVVYSSAFTLPNQQHVWARRLGLPLARDGQTIDMVLGTYVLRAPDPSARPSLVVCERHDAVGPALRTGTG